MFALLLIAVVAVASQATPVYFKPTVYSPPASVYVQPAPVAVRYAAPLVVNEAPKPYSFGYEAPAIGGGSTRQETSDGTGRVTGSYTVSDADGRLRVVDYYADETGFHANVKTNEPGTANQDSADVSVQSYAAPAPVIAASPKVITTAPVYSVPSPKVVTPARVIAPAPVYTVAAPIRPITRSVVAPFPASYGFLPAYNSLRYAPAHYGLYNGYYGAYAPRLNYYYK